MALKDEPSPKCAFLTATAAVGVTAAAATATAAALDACSSRQQNTMVLKDEPLAILRDYKVVPPSYSLL